MFSGPQRVGERERCGSGGIGCARTLISRGHRGSALLCVDRVGMIAEAVNAHLRLRLLALSSREVAHNLSVELLTRDTAGVHDAGGAIVVLCQQPKLL